MDNDDVVEILVRTMDFCESNVMDTHKRIKGTYSDEVVEGMMLGLKICLATMQGFAEAHGLEVEDGDC